MKLSCIIVDDEPYAQKLLEDYVEKISILDHVGTFISPLKAVEYIRKRSVDIIFLDIEMPDINGMDFSALIDPSKTKIIFTTAYSTYAVESYERNALDYLVKPINFDRFLKAVYKFPFKNKDAPLITDKNCFFYVKSGRDLLKITFDDLLYVKGLKDYVVFKTSTEEHVVNKSLKSLEKELPKQFLRTHYSYIINLDKVDALKDNQMIIQDTRLPISKSYKSLVLKLIKEKLI